MPNPQQPAQPQQGQPAGAAGFNPGAVAQLFQDLVTAVPAVAPHLEKIIRDLKDVFLSGAAPMQAAQAVKCGPNGTTDKNQACDALLEHLTLSMGLALHCRCCC